MPRLSQWLLSRARTTHALVPMLLKPLRTVESATHELKWLQNHAANLALHSGNHVMSRIRALRQNRNCVRISRKKRCLIRQNRKRTASLILLRLCKLRARGTPLQYLLGTTYFGELELHTLRGVLIPRQDTADMIEALAKRLLQSGGFVDHLRNNSGSRNMSLLDLCTGSGCVGLLLRQLLLRSSAKAAENLDTFPDTLPPKENETGLLRSIELLGIDISPKAIALAKRNATLVFPQAASKDVIYDAADVLAFNDTPGPHIYSPKIASTPALSTVLTKYGRLTWDIVVANPPYISRETLFSSTTSRSVRGFEPRGALLPAFSLQCKPTQGSQRDSFKQGDVEDNDIFYAGILRHARDVEAKVIWLEVGDSSQALRVAQMLLEQGSWKGGVEIWTDRNGADGTSGAIQFGRAVLRREQGAVTAPRERSHTFVSDINVHQGRTFSVFAQRAKVESHSQICENFAFSSC